jgi:hypothetical protein
VEYYKLRSDSNDLTLSQLIEENPEVVFTLNLPGLLPTKIHDGGMFGRWYGRAIMWIIGISVEGTGQRSFFFVDQCEIWWEGGAVAERGEWRAYYGGDGRGLLFYVVDYELEGLQQESLMANFWSQDAGTKVQAKLQEVLARTCEDRT